jgi:DNA-nicking Smr family endonuclease
MRKLKSDEHRLWERVTRSVAPLRASPRDHADVRPAAARTPKRLQPHGANIGRSAVLREPPAPVAPLDRRQRRRLARGTEAIDGRIDLHGKTQSQAHSALLAFLRRAQMQDARFVLVVTGKGSASREDGAQHGVLKRQVPLWLDQPEFRKYVIAFEQAHASHGGEGALYVRLRRPRVLK